DARGLLLNPGLIDMQCNGLCGLDVLDGRPETVRSLATALVSFGCTAVLPTLVTSPPEVLQASLSAIAAVARPGGPGARVLGAHLEGPWLNPAHKGAHPLRWIRPFAMSEWEALLAAAGGSLKLVTLAPERPGNDQAVRKVAAEGALVSLGHSGASYEQAAAAV